MNDFGFTAVTEEELESVKMAELQISDTQDTIKNLETALNDLHQAIIPLLDNLSKNPEKDFIHWPKRIDKINEFKDELQEIVNKGLY
jgi:tetrahydromethanopterin S-methyltransferase subunit B